MQKIGIFIGLMLHTSFIFCAAQSSDSGQPMSRLEQLAHVASESLAKEKHEKKPHRKHTLSSHAHKHRKSAKKQKKHPTVNAHREGEVAHLLHIITHNYEYVKLLQAQSVRQHAIISSQEAKIAELQWRLAHSNDVQHNTAISETHPQQVTAKEL